MISLEWKTGWATGTRRDRPRMGRVGEREREQLTFKSSGRGVLHRVRSLSMSFLARVIVPAETSPVRSSSTNMSAIRKQSWWLSTHFRGIFSTRKPIAIHLHICYCTYMYMYMKERTEQNAFKEGQVFRSHTVQTSEKLGYLSNRDTVSSTEAHAYIHVHVPPFEIRTVHL